MTQGLHNLQANRAAHKRKKRLGRGNASGHGTYSTRGLKGQKARSGVSNLERLGLRQMLRAIPKQRGFKSRQANCQAVNLAQLNQQFKTGQLVNPTALLKLGLIAKIKLPVKILAKGELAVKGLIFQKVQFSGRAKELILKVDGQIK